MTELRPVHFSARDKRMLPRNMSRLAVSNEHYEAAVRVALDIFADCTNSGASFHDALLAVYLSGLQHGQALSKEVQS